MFNLNIKTTLDPIKYFILNIFWSNKYADLLEILNKNKQFTLFLTKTIEQYNLLIKNKKELHNITKLQLLKKAFYKTTNKKIYSPTIFEYNIDILNNYLIGINYPKKMNHLKQTLNNLWDKYEDFFINSNITNSNDIDCNILIEEILEDIKNVENQIIICEKKARRKKIINWIVSISVILIIISLII